MVLNRLAAAGNRAFGRDIDRIFRPVTARCGAGAAYFLSPTVSLYRRLTAPV
jgi:hypothetical protein